MSARSRSPRAILSKAGSARARPSGRSLRNHTVIGATHPQRRARAAATSPSSCARRTSASTVPATPTACTGEEIPLPSRIVFACDAFHAMSSDRPYAPGNERSAGSGGAHAAAPEASSTLASSKRSSPNSQSPVRSIARSRPMSRLTGRASSRNCHNCTPKRDYGVVIVDLEGVPTPSYSPARVAMSRRSPSSTAAMSSGCCGSPPGVRAALSMPVT